MTQAGNVPLTARSVLASALLGEDPPELPVAHLVHLAGLFGINDNRARVALSRMAAAGEVTTDGAGRYRLAGHLLDRQDRQTGSRRGETRRWEGQWRLVVVTTSGRVAEDRLARRKRLSLARLAEQREGVWLRPDNIDLVPDPPVIPTSPSSPPDLTRIRPPWPPISGTSGSGRSVPGTWLPGWKNCRPPARPLWRRGSSCPPPCSATCRPIRFCLPSCCPPTGRAPPCAAPTTDGTGGTGRW